MKSSFESSPRTEYAQSPNRHRGVSVLERSSGMFLWPVWARAHTAQCKGTPQMARPISRRGLLLRSCNGTPSALKNSGSLICGSTHGRKPRT